MVNGEWATLRGASSLIPSNVSMAEPLLYHNGSMGRCVDRVNNLSSCKWIVVRRNVPEKRI